MKSETIKTSTGREFRVVPSLWWKMRDKDIVKRFDSYCEFVSQHEKKMSETKLDKALDILYNWAEHIEERGLIEQTKHSWLWPGR